MNTLILLLLSLSLGFPTINSEKEWNKKTEKDFVGYRLYWRTAGNIFTDQNSINCLHKNVGSLASLPEKAIIVMSGFDGMGNESKLSNEIPLPPSSVLLVVTYYSKRIDDKTNHIYWIGQVWESMSSDVGNKYKEIWENAPEYIPTSGLVNKGDKWGDLVIQPMPIK